MSEAETTHRDCKVYKSWNQRIIFTSEWDSPRVEIAKKKRVIIVVSDGRYSNSSLEHTHFQYMEGFSFALYRINYFLIQ
jgi:hypothetical protein